MIDALLQFTSAAIKAKVLKDMTKKAAAVDNRSMKEDSARIAANNPRSRAWLHPGVVGEKDSWNTKIMNWILYFSNSLLILKYFWQNIVKKTYFYFKLAFVCVSK